MNYKERNEREVLCNFLGALKKCHLRLVKNVFKPIAKSVFIPLGLMAAVLAAYGVIQKKKKMKDIIKIAKSIEKLGSMIESVREIIKNETKNNNKKMTFWHVIS